MRLGLLPQELILYVHAVSCCDCLVLCRLSSVKPGSLLGSQQLNSFTCTGLADVCHCYGVPLIVDEAHGSHFAFDPEFPQVLLSPILGSAFSKTCTLDRIKYTSYKPSPHSGSFMWCQI